MKWTKKGFSEFTKGTMGNAGQNLYVSRKGVLQRIFNFDLDGNGYPDMPFTSGHSMDERPRLHVYDDLNQEKPLEFSTYGTFDAVFADLNGNGTEDLIIGCQHDGVHSDVQAIIYYGSERGLSDKYRSELRVPNCTALAAGDFRGTGKQDLIFISYTQLRAFYQSDDMGIEASNYKTLEISALSLDAGDLDGDGYDDIYVIHQSTGELAVYWGSPDGFSEENKTSFARPTPLGYEMDTATPGRKFLRKLPWRCSVVSVKGQNLAFVSEGHDAVFYSFKNREPKEEYRFTCSEHVHHTTVGDLKNKGGEDIVLAVAADRNKEYDCLVLWDDQGYDPKKATHLPTRDAQTATVGPVGADKRNYLFIAQGGKRETYEVTSKVYSFDESGTAKVERIFDVKDASRILTGRTYTDGRYQIVVANHEGYSPLGLDPTYVYYGDADGYRADRRLELPSFSTTDALFCDFNDDGRPDILASNCCENAPHLNPGNTIFWNSEQGITGQDMTYLKTILCEGSAVGDFRKSGYLDIICGQRNCRELRIFEGGPDGYQFDQYKTIVLGPEPELCDPFPWDQEDVDPSFDDAENARIREFGGCRWLFAADFNNDGWLDICVSQLFGPRFMILWGGPEGFSVDRMQVLASEGIVTSNAADLDGDGWLDLVVSSYGTLKKQNGHEAYTTIYWGGPDGFQEHRKVELPSMSVSGLAIADFNNDGILDIYGSAYLGIRTRDMDSFIYYGSADGVFHLENKKPIFTNSGSGCLAGDFNGDGYVDLAVASHKKEGNHVCDSFVFWGGEDGINETRYTALPANGPHGMHTVDIGNVMDRSDSEYYYSEPYQLPNGTKATKASWEAELGVSNWVTMQLRWADSEDELENAEWKGIGADNKIQNGDDLSALGACGVIQYKLELGARCGCGTPRVTEITIDFK